MKTYTTRTEAVDREIIDPVENGDASAEEYDIEAIADELVKIDTTGIDPKYYVDVNEDIFWETIANHQM